MVEIEQKLYNDIKQYCKLNELVIKDFINKLLKKAFTIEKYGERPFVYLNSVPVDKCVPNKKHEMELPNEYPYNTVIVTPTEIQTEIMETVDEHDFELLSDNDSTIVEPKKENKSKKRKL